MALVVISYPAISAGDFAWIQSVRRKHDRLSYHVVPPHFTIVFPVSDLDQDQLTSLSPVEPIL